MSTPPDPTEIFQRAVDEGKRRLDQTTIELVATSFIAGFTVVIASLHSALPTQSSNLNSAKSLG